MKNIKTPLILMLATFLAAGLLMVSEFATKDQIEKQKKIKLINSLKTLIPPELHDNDLSASAFVLEKSEDLNLQENTLAYLGTKNQKPSVIALPVISHDGYSGDIELLVGIKMNGQITAVKIIDQKETPGLGDLILASKSDWIQQLFGSSLQKPQANLWKVKKDGGNFDQITGATISPRAVVTAVKAALIFHQNNQQNYLQWMSAHE